MIWSDGSKFEIRFFDPLYSRKRGTNFWKSLYIVGARFINKKSADFVYAVPRRFGEVLETHREWQARE